MNITPQFLEELRDRYLSIIRRMEENFYRFEENLTLFCALYTELKEAHRTSEKVFQQFKKRTFFLIHELKGELTDSTDERWSAVLRRRRELRSEIDELEALLTPKRTYGNPPEIYGIMGRWYNTSILSNRSINPCNFLDEIDLWEEDLEEGDISEREAQNLIEKTKRGYEGTKYAWITFLEPEGERGGISMTDAMIDDFQRLLEGILQHTPTLSSGVDRRYLMIEGFRVELVGESSVRRSFPIHKAMRFFAFLLKEYRKRTTKYFPSLINRQVPLVLMTSIEFWKKHLLLYDVDSITDTAFAFYSSSKVNVNFYLPNLWKKRIDQAWIDLCIQVLAHEMGHYWYREALDQEDRDFWRAFAEMENDIDVRELISDLQHADIKFFEDLHRHIPLHLQLFLLREKKPEIFAVNPLWEQAMMNRYGKKTFLTGALKQYLRKGGNPFVQVKTALTTSYGSTDPEEEFCEAVGLVIGYGPRRIPYNVRVVLNHILPLKRVNPRAANLSSILSVLGEPLP